MQLQSNLVVANDDGQFMSMSGDNPGLQDSLRGSSFLPIQWLGSTYQACQDISGPGRAHVRLVRP